jgi:hypothetical protein
MRPAPGADQRPEETDQAEGPQSTTAVADRRRRALRRFFFGRDADGSEESAVVRRQRERGLRFLNRPPVLLAAVVAPRREIRGHHHPETALLADYLHIDVAPSSPARRQRLAEAGHRRDDIKSVSGSTRAVQTHRVPVVLPEGGSFVQGESSAGTTST